MVYVTPVFSSVWGFTYKVKMKGYTNLPYTDTTNVDRDKKDGVEK